MPELPEVETVARTLSPHVLGKKIVDIQLINQNSWQGLIQINQIVNANLQPLISEVGRRGKLLIIYLKYPNENSPAFGIGVHLKMTGKLFPYSGDAKPNKHTRIIFKLDDDTQIFFDDMRKFGYARALNPENNISWKFWQNLGKDPFEMSEAEFIQLIKNKKTAMKSLLLNQEIIAGIGNIYADEILFKSQIHPKTMANKLTDMQLAKIYQASIDILTEAIAACGSSIRDYRTANGDVGSFQNKFFVYNKAGESCKVCNNIIEKTKAAGRTTCYCSNCQILL